jgi:hypothetical protein
VILQLRCTVMGAGASANSSATRARIPVLSARNATMVQRVLGSRYDEEKFDIISFEDMPQADLFHHLHEPIGAVTRP